jgi:spore coat protein U-like protein
VKRAPGRIRRALPLLAVLASWSGGPAVAACTVSAVGVTFGVYTPSSPAPLNANGSVTVNCALDSGFWQTYNFTASFSTGSSLSYASRQMVRSGGTQPLNYNLYNSSYAQVLGNGGGGTITVSGSIFVWLFDPSNAVATPMAGRIPPLQNAVPGSYLDTIIVTLNF